MSGLIQLATEGAAAVRISPVGWLGGDFEKFKRATEGAKYIYARKVNVAPIDKVPRILRRLREEGFEVAVSPDVALLLEGFQANQWFEAQGARDRVALIAEETIARTNGVERFREYQKVAAEWLISRHGALLADDMGLGKTASTIAAIPANAPVLVVCPAVAKGVWARELRKWRPSFTKITKIDGRGNFRWPAPGEVVLINYDVLPDAHDEACEDAKTCQGCAEHLPDCPPELTMVVDEAHNVKSSKAKRTRNTRAIGNAARGKKGRTWLLTATPILNRPPELWSLLQVAGCAEEAFGTWKNFVAAFDGKTKYVGNKACGIQWGQPTEEVLERIRGVMLRRLKTEVLDELPAKSHDIVVVDVDKKALATLDKVLADLGGVNAIASLLAGGKVEFETWSRVSSALAKAKTPAMLEMVESYEEAGEPVVVFSAHRAPIDLLAERDGWAVITGDTPASDRTQIEDAFQRGELRGIGCTIKAGGVAITLTRASNEIFVDREPVPALNEQAEDRCYRMGQKRAVLIRSLVARHPLDERITEILMSKRALVAATVEAARVQPGEKPQPPDEIDLDALRQAVFQEFLLDAKTKRASLKPKRRGAQTARETWALEGLARLADADSDHATEKNGVGFNKFDGEPGRQLSADASSRGLTEKQWSFAIALVQKYTKQIGVLLGEGS